MNGLPYWMLEKLRAVIPLNGGNGIFRVFLNTLNLYIFFCFDPGFQKMWGL